MTKNVPARRETNPFVGGIEGVKSVMKIDEIRSRLGIGRMAIYGMLERGQLPGIRVGRRWIVTRQAYERWERTCGIREDSVTFTNSPDTIN
jgi:excisionase family DNA binding protein